MLERALVARAGARDRIEPGHGLDVVSQNIRPGGDDGAKRASVALEIGNQNLNSDSMAGGPGLPDGLGENVGSAILQIIAIDRGYDGVLETEFLKRGSYPSRLVEIVVGRKTGLDGAELAGACAHIAEDHESCRAGSPALSNVGASGILAHGIHAVLTNEVLQIEISLTPGQAHFEPSRAWVPTVAHTGLAGQDRERI